MLDPVLEKQLVYKGRKITVCVSDKVMEYDPNFRMYFITRYEFTHSRNRWTAEGLSVRSREALR